MKIRLKIVLVMITVVFTVLGLQAKSIDAAGNCKNTTCDGLNPNTMACPASRAGSPKVLGDGYSYVETRVSGTSDCDAKWARTKNLSGSYKYAAGSVRYGCANYCYEKSVSSPGSIANNETVYTAMLAYAVTWTRSCGAIASSGPIGIPLTLSDTYCTGAN